MVCGKEAACQYRRPERCGFDPWVRKIPLEKEMATHPSILAWEIPWRKRLAAYSPQGHIESDITKATQHAMEALTW